MVAVAHHHGRSIPLPPFVEVTAVVILHLAHFPHIEGLIQNQETQAIARVEERRRWWVMRGADGVIAGRFQQFHTTFLSAIECSSPERSIVVMHAAPGKLDGFS